jgi:hypothetical protein
VLRIAHETAIGPWQADTTGAYSVAWWGVHFPLHSESALFIFPKCGFQPQVMAAKGFGETVNLQTSIDQNPI